MLKNLLILFLLFIGTTLTQQLDAQSLMGRWDFAESKDGSEYIPRDEGALGVADDKLFLLGGRGIDEMSVFDLKKKVWSTASKPPIEMHHFQCVTYNDKLYVLGALTGKYPDETPIPNIYIYDPETGAWSKGPEIPADRRRGAAGAVVYKDKIYLLCGIQNGHKSGHVAWFDEYDPEMDTWTKLADAPRVRDHFQATVVDGKLYAVGGRTSMAPDKTFTETIGEVDMYDIEKKIWYTVPINLPTQRAGATVVSLGKYVVVVGGESASSKEAHIETEAFDTKKYQWVKMVSLIDGRHGMGAAVYKGKIYIAGGNGNRGAGLPIESMEVFTIKI
ncbi:MAG: galactose oxidase [Cyclobacteriaceae bacterium]